MKEKITFTLVKTNARNRIYKASQRLTNNAKGNRYSGLGETHKMYANKERTETKDWVTPDHFDHVVVSDAHTHEERLTFPCWEIEPVVGNNPYLWVTDNIAGVNTFMTHGGDDRTVKPDAVYLRMLAKANGYQYTRGD